MTDREPSRTAVGVALMRAAHQLYDAIPKILDDSVVLQLLSPAMLNHVRGTEDHYRAAGATQLRSHLMIRSRYAEDRLAEAVQRGIRQFVSLGAGFDTFPYRQPMWARSLRIFEVDQPASQRIKRERLEAGAILIPPNVEFVPIDFETTSLDDGLAASSFDPTLPTFFSWLGVMMYLTPEANDAVFRYVLSLPRTSEIVFTFASPAAPERSAESARPSVAELAARGGEPWLTRIDPDVLTAHLLELGFTSVVLPTPEQIEAWYIQDRQDGLHASPRRTIASAIV
ncbi:MAG: class I SAM-dependent methyltransferase [Anaerolineae bacterium]|nr:class I SAM-dependent methyltransferase [Anaerolineae bacterium]